METDKKTLEERMTELMRYDIELFEHVRKIGKDLGYEKGRLAAFGEVIDTVKKGMGE